MRNVINVPTPGASGFTYTIPVQASGVRKLRSVCYKVTATATVGNRNFVLRLTTKSGNKLFESAPPAAQTATNVVVYSYMPGGDGSSANTAYNCAIPQDIEINEGDIFQCVDNNGIDAADRVTEISITEEWA